MKFTDGTHIGGIANTEEEWNIIQEEMDDLEDSSNTTGIKFNSINFKNMHLRTDKKNVCCNLGIHQLEIIEEKKNQGVFDHSLSMRKNVTVGKGKKILYISSEIFPMQDTCETSFGEMCKILKPSYSKRMHSS